MWVPTVGREPAPSGFFLLKHALGSLEATTKWFLQRRRKQLAVRAGGRGRAAKFGDLLVQYSVHKGAWVCSPTFLSWPTLFSLCAYQGPGHSSPLLERVSEEPLRRLLAAAWRVPAREPRAPSGPRNGGGVHRRWNSAPAEERQQRGRRQGRREKKGKKDENKRRSRLKRFRQLSAPPSCPDLAPRIEPFSTSH